MLWYTDTDLVFTVQTFSAESLSLIINKEFSMNITVLNYLDQALVDNVNAQVKARAQEAKAAQEAAAVQTSGATASSGSDFSSVLNEAVTPDQTSGAGRTFTQTTASSVNCPENLDSIFEEAAQTYNVSSKLLKAIAKAESNFNPHAVSRAGAVGVMQLMPATAASLGVSDSYDARQNIMGGAKYIAQLLARYNGNVSLALAAYNAGGANVDKYGGIPPFTETQNYVRKVLSYLNGDITIPNQTGGTSPFTLSEGTRNELTQALSSFFGSQSAGQNAMDVLAGLLGFSGSTGSSGAASGSSGGTAAVRDRYVSPSSLTTLKPSIELRVVSESIETDDPEEPVRGRSESLTADETFAQAAGTEDGTENTDGSLPDNGGPDGSGGIL